MRFPELAPLDKNVQLKPKMKSSNNDLSLVANQKLGGTATKLNGPFEGSAKKNVEAVQDPPSRAERSSPAGQANSDRVSDNDSNASSSGVNQKSKTKNA